MNLIIKTEEETLLDINFEDAPTQEQTIEIMKTADRPVVSINMDVIEGLTMQQIIAEEVGFMKVITKATVTVK